MKARYCTIAAALSLAVLCLGSARAAHAATVAGHGNFSWYGGSSVSVSAESGPGGTAGTLHLNLGSDYFYCEVIGLWVVDNKAIVLGHVMSTSVPNIEPYFYLLVQDNGPTNDQFRFFSNTNTALAGYLGANFATYLNGGPVLPHGGFVVHP